MVSISSETVYLAALVLIVLTITAMLFVENYHKIQLITLSFVLVADHQSSRARTLTTAESSCTFGMNSTPFK